MAVQYNIQLRGKIGNVVYFKRGNGSFAKGAPRKYKQTKATKAQSAVFGKASQTASRLWQMLKPWAANSADNTTWNRLNKAMAEWLRTNPLNDTQPQNDLPFIAGFQLNTACTLEERLKVSLKVSLSPESNLVLVIPELCPTKDIVAPAHTKSIDWSVLAVSCSLSAGPPVERFIHNMQMPYADTSIAAQEIVMPCKALPGNLTLVAVSLKYNTITNRGESVVANKVWMPNGVEGAMFN